MTTTWFTADTHFGHAGIIRHCKRPFTSVPEMDAALVELWNSVVKPTDDVWHLGDFEFLAKLHDAEHYLRQLHGRIHFVEGNHDDHGARKIKHLFASYQEVKYLRMNGEQIYLSHYAHRVWRNSHKGAWHLYGHTHGSIPHYHRSMDVGVDVHSLMPISFDQIKAYMDVQDFTHHHPEMKTDPWTFDEQEKELQNKERLNADRNV